MKCLLPDKRKGLHGYSKSECGLGVRISVSPTNQAYSRLIKFVNYGRKLLSKHCLCVL